MFFHIDGAELQRRRERENWTRGLLARMSRVHPVTIKKMERAAGPYRTTDKAIEQIFAAFDCYGSQPITVADLSEDYFPATDLLPKVYYDNRAVRNIRSEKGLTLEQVAERSGLSVATVQRLEHKSPPSARADTLVVLAKSLGTQVGRICQPLAGVPSEAYDRR
jgi:transcriptional regulator with XRE-family HTH domain